MMIHTVRMGGLVIAMAVACDDKGGETATVETKSETKTETKTETKSAAPKNDDAKTAGIGDDAVTPGNDICKSFDKDKVASALGWQGISKISGVGGTAKGVRHRHCGFTGKNANMDQHFGVTFSTATEFEAEHVGFKAKYEPRAAVGGFETRVAKNDRVVILQMKTPEMLVTVDAAETDKTPADLEPKLEAAAIALVGSLPPEAKAILEKK
jgi:hypothetical protein